MPFGLNQNLKRKVFNFKIHYILLLFISLRVKLYNECAILHVKFFGNSLGSGGGGRGGGFTAKCILGKCQSPEFKKLLMD